MEVEPLEQLIQNSWTAFVYGPQKARTWKFRQRKPCQSLDGYNGNIIYVWMQIGNKLTFTSPKT